MCGEQEEGRRGHYSLEEQTAPPSHLVSRFLPNKELVHVASHLLQVCKPQNQVSAAGNIQR